jgi:hypothetical protein
LLKAVSFNSRIRLNSKRSETNGCSGENNSAEGAFQFYSQRFVSLKGDSSSARAASSNLHNQLFIWNFGLRY